MLTKISHKDLQIKKKKFKKKEFLLKRLLYRRINDNKINDLNDHHNLIRDMRIKVKFLSS